MDSIKLLLSLLKLFDELSDTVGEYHECLQKYPGNPEYCVRDKYRAILIARVMRSLIAKMKRDAEREQNGELLKHLNMIDNIIRLIETTYLGLRD